MSEDALPAEGPERGEDQRAGPGWRAERSRPQGQRCPGGGDRREQASLQPCALLSLCQTSTGLTTSRPTPKPRCAGGPWRWERRSRSCRSRSARQSGPLPGRIPGEVSPLRRERAARALGTPASGDAPVTGQQPALGVPCGCEGAEGTAHSGTQTTPTTESQQGPRRLHPGSTAPGGPELAGGGPSLGTGFPLLTLSLLSGPPQVSSPAWPPSERAFPFPPARSPVAEVRVGAH